MKREVIIPEKMQEMVRKLKSDEENDHSRFFCDLADCKLCEARKHIEEESNWSDDSLPSQVNTSKYRRRTNILRTFSIIFANNANSANTNNVSLLL